MRWWAASILILSWAAAGCGIKAKIAGGGDSAVAVAEEDGAPAYEPVTETTRTVTLSPFGREGLVPTMRSDLDDALSELMGRDLYFQIEGHTDATGSEATNERVGLKRAEMVRDYLLEQYGIAEERIDVMSYGEVQPVVDNDTAEHRAQNRRVVVSILAR